MRQCLLFHFCILTLESILSSQCNFIVNSHEFILIIDIEDKGTSGETFLAAVEYLEQEKPDVAIFENVDKAPWEKMQVCR